LAYINITAITITTTDINITVIKIIAVICYIDIGDSDSCNGKINDSESSNSDSGNSKSDDSYKWNMTAEIVIVVIVTEIAIVVSP
jgi:anaerobic C4-dicarboxylate transporter